MPWKDIDGRGLTVAQFKDHVAGLRFDNWRPSFVAVHNTANPSLNPLPAHGSWHGSSTTPENRVRKSLVTFYRDTMGWGSGPHLFIADDLIWLFTPLTTSGTHSPSWNGTALGFEMVGDYELEAFDSGPGAKVRDNAVAALAIVHAKLGLNPETIRLHKEDPRTTHDCPGKNVKKPDLIRRVQEFMADGGEHTTADESTVTPPAARSASVNVDGLNLRSAASASAEVLATLAKDTKLQVIGETMNGTTKWLRVKAPQEGWVSASFVTLG
jgi:Bacterial SH3 domain/N-acetylmuramoyl-L-alanine amidase